jgi:hypothetical protein
VKQLTDIELTEGQSLKYSLKMTIFDDSKKGLEMSDVIAIRGDDLDMILDWAEWKITNELCGFKHGKKNKMEDYKEVI